HPVGDLAHEAAVDVHAFAVERRAHEAPLAQVARAVEEQDRVPAEDRPEDGCDGFAGAELVAVGGEDVLDPPGVGEDHHLPALADRVDGVALAPATRRHRDRRVWPEREAETLPPPRRARPRRQRREGGGGGGLGDERAHASLLGAQRGRRPCMRISPYSGSASWYG